MGWTGTYKEPGEKLIDFFRREFRFAQSETEDGLPTGLLDFATVGPHVGYGAARGLDGTVFGLVVLIRYPKDDYENIVYKAMDEDMGPNESRCPARILDLLSPLPEDGHRYAREWRERCRANLAKGKRPPVKDGTVIRFDVPLRFQDGKTHDTFLAEKSRGKTVFHPVKRDETTGKWTRTHFYVHIINGWTKMAYHVVGLVEGR